MPKAHRDSFPPHQPRVIPPRWSRKAEEVVFPYTIKKEPWLPPGPHPVLIIKGLVSCDYDTVSKLLQDHGFTSSVKVIHLCPLRCIATIELSSRRLLEAAVITFNGLLYNSMTLTAESRQGPEGDEGSSVLADLRLEPDTTCRAVTVEDSECSSSEAESPSSSSSAVPMMPTPTPAIAAHERPGQVILRVDQPTVANIGSRLTARPLNLRRSPPLRSQPVNRDAGHQRLAQSADLRKPTKVVHLPIASHSRPRRILAPRSSHFPFVTISMRCDIQFIDRDTRCRLSTFSLPCQEKSNLVEDACLVLNTVVIGFGKGTTQVAMIDFESDDYPKLVNVPLKPHEQSQTRNGISCLAAMSGGSQFVSGGNDNRVYLWDIGETSLSACRATKLTELTAAPAALVHHRNSLLACTGKSITTVNLSRPTAKPYHACLSNEILQAHHNPSIPALTIFEVKHLEEQINIFDDRGGGFTRRPDILFGYRATQGDTSRHVRGGFHQGGGHFVRGYGDGLVLAWDLRNIKKPCARFRHCDAKGVSHASFLSSDIIAYGEHKVSFLDQAV